MAKSAMADARRLSGRSTCAVGVEAEKEWFGARKGRERDIAGVGEGDAGLEV
jgi:hypothetical protein